MQETQETWVWSLGWEHHLMWEMATSSSILTWKIPWTERKLAGYTPQGHKELDMSENSRAQNIPLYPCPTSSLSIHLSLDIF